MTPAMRHPPEQLGLLIAAIIYLRRDLDIGQATTYAASIPDAQRALRVAAAVEVASAAGGA